MNDKKKIFTGITLTGKLTIGHYLGIIKKLIELQNEYEIIIMIADLHALTNFKKNNNINYSEECLKMATVIYSCGFKKKNCKVFIQSNLSKERSELFLMLSSFITVEKLSNMIQYKEKKNEKNNNLSLLSYPLLMAADIFLYKVDLVIVGKDQKQHCELINFLGKKINKLFDEEILKLPKFTIPELELGGKIMGLKNPEKKMSKSDEDNILITDNEKEINYKIMRAKTDNENKIIYDPKKKPGISNLIIIYSILKNKSINEIEKEFFEKNYHEFKLILSKIINKTFKKINKNIEKNSKKIKSILEKNKKKMENEAKKTNKLFRKKIKIENE